MSRTRAILIAVLVFLGAGLAWQAIDGSIVSVVSQGLAAVPALVQSIHIGNWWVILAIALVVRCAFGSSCGRHRCGRASHAARV